MVVITAGAALIGSTAVNVGMSLWGGSKAANAAAAQAEAQNKAMMARYQYDMDMWDMKKKQLQAQRMEAVDGILTKARNDGVARAYTDAMNEEQYQRALLIRDQEQEANEAQFTRSEEIYDSTTDLNSRSAKAAMDSELIKLEESQDSRAFSANDAYIEMLQAEGSLRAKGASGRSASKNIQATLADYGRQMELLNATDSSSDRNVRGVLDEIIRDKTSADLTAYAQKMLDPGVLPDPIKIPKLPVPEIELPRVLQSYDFGPQPVMGAMASPGAAADAVWGQTITNIGGSIAGLGSGLASNASNLGQKLQF